jgi:tetratricopeptide (TPR) repeat protein
VTLYEARGYYDDWSAATEYALSAARSAGDARGTATMLTSLASLRVQSGQIDHETRGLAERALRLFSQSGDLHGCAIAHYRLGVVYVRTGQVERAIGIYEQGRRDARHAGDVFLEAGLLRELGSAYLEREDHEAAAVCLSESLLLHEATGSLRGRALTLHTLGELHLRRGDPQGAKRVFEQVLDMIQATNDIVGQAHVNLRLGETLVYADSPDQAEERLLVALRLARQTRLRAIEARAALPWTGSGPGGGHSVPPTRIEAKRMSGWRQFSFRAST